MVSREERSTASAGSGEINSRESCPRASTSVSSGISQAIREEWIASPVIGEMVSDPADDAPRATDHGNKGEAMFHDIPQVVLERMTYLEKVDALDRIDGTPRDQRLRQIPAETGKFIALLAAAAPPGQYVEIGTSAGYSTLWLVLACRFRGRQMTTFEILEKKVELARETIRVAEVDDVVTLVHGDVLDHLPSCESVSFCFLDVEKEIYSECYEAVVPNLVPGGILVADNAINHKETLQPMLDRALADERVDALIVPIGRGELVCRKR